MSVVEFPGPTRLEKDPQRILDQAKAAGLTSVIVIGWEPVAGGDEMPWFLSSIPDVAGVSFLLRHFDLKLHLDLICGDPGEPGGGDVA